MKYLILFLLTSIVVSGDDITLDKKESLAAFNMLLDIRNYPSKYCVELAFCKDASVSPVKLNWNDTLAKVAEQKAYDMAQRNYYGHVDPDGYGINYFIAKAGYKLDSNWTKDKSANYFESLTANFESGSEAVKWLVKDSLTPLLDHRKHLLGQGDWYSKCSDVGIGFSKRANGSQYKSYVCIIVARH